jgi:hypothetical protein
MSPFLGLALSPEREWAGIWNIPQAIHIINPPPAKAISTKAVRLVSKGARPRKRAASRVSSNRAWPSIKRGPTIQPCSLVPLSEMVALSRGPGIRAPERVIVKEVINITQRLPIRFSL